MSCFACACPCLQCTNCRRKKDVKAAVRICELFTRRFADADLLAVLPAPLRDLAAQGVVRRYRANTTLIEEGDRGDTLFVVLGGSLRIFCADPNGKEITLAIYGP